MKINYLYRFYNFPKVQNFWRVVVFVFLQTTAFGQQVNTNPKAYATLDTNMMLIGDQSKLHLSVELNEGERVVNIAPDMPMDTAHFEILNAGKWENHSRTPKLERDIAFIAWDSGLYRINSVVFTIQGTDGSQRTIETPPVLLTVNNPRGTEGMLAPIGIKDIVREEWMWEDVMPYIIGIVLIGGIAFLAFAVYRKWKNRDTKPVVQKVIQPPHIIAERLLQELHAKQLWQNGKIKEYYSDLSHILRGYLENQFTMPALESTTDELITTLQKRHFDDAVVDKMQGLLQTADLVKFAKVEPPMDVHEPFWGDATAVVALTKPKPVVESIENQRVDS